MAKHKSKGWTVYYVGLALIMLWFLLPVFVKALFYESAQLFSAPVVQGLGKIGETQDYMAMRLKSKSQLIRDLRTLSRKQSHYRNLLHEQSIHQHYTDRLERLLSMKPIRDYRFAYARITRRTINAWFECLTLDKGLADGIEKGMAVVNAGGLIGRIEEVSNSASTVKLITSPSFRITVNPASDGRPITFFGQGQLAWAPVEAGVLNVPQDLQATKQQPITLYTTGLGGTLPSGLRVGELVELETQMEGLFQQGTVRLDEELRSLREVAVLIPLTQGS